MENIYYDVLAYKIEKDIEFIKTKKSYHSKFFSEEEREAFAKFIANKSDVFNGKTISLLRLEEFPEKITIDLGESDFFELLITNIFYLKRDEVLRRAKENADVENLIKRMDEEIQKLKKEDSFEGIINSKVLSNAIAVSILVQDRNSDLLFVERTNNLAIGAGLLSVSATGALDGIDLHSMNPIVNCAKRELKEELNINTSNIHLDSIVLAKNKLQPICILNAKIDKSFNEIVEEITSAEDYRHEVNQLYCVPKRFVKKFIKERNMTDAARYHIDKCIEGVVQEEFDDRKMFKLT